MTTRPHLAPRLEKEQSHISTPSLGLHGQFWGELYLYHKIKEDEMGWVCGIHSLHTEFWRGNLKRPLGRPCRS